MKQNTKFLWMYICILFSFAIILIVFAGISNKELSNTKGLTNKVETVSSENLSLKEQNKLLKEELSNQEQKYDLLEDEKNAYVNEKEVFNANEELLTKALAEFDNENYEKAVEIVNQINKDTLTESQMYLYNMIINR